MDRWSIVARITFKSEMKKYGNFNDHFFSLDLIDCDKTEIHAYFFKKACAKFHNLLVVGKVSYHC
jgi:hypothetical protein